ncbi:MAG: hypothetical protein HQK55_18220 [Deltaproteobacteria bacterium]|nr:hypothetical protein [Deltaproteobacteria bacterium]
MKGAKMVTNHDVVQNKDAASTTKKKDWQMPALKEIDYTSTALTEPNAGGDLASYS